MYGKRFFKRPSDKITVQELNQFIGKLTINPVDKCEYKQCSFGAFRTKFSKHMQL